MSLCFLRPLCIALHCMQSAEDRRIARRGGHIEKIEDAVGRLSSPENKAAPLFVTRARIPTSVGT